MKRLALIFLALMIFPMPSGAPAEETYTFDPAEIAKKPYSVAGYVEVKPIVFGLDRNAALYKLRYFNDPQGQTQMEANGRVQLEGSYEKNMLRVFGKLNTDLKYGYAGGSERTTFYEAYGSLKPSASWKIDIGKKTMKWGKGYAWNPVAFIDRPKDPDDPEQAMEGYILATADFISRLDGPLSTVSFTPVLFPVYDHINDAFGNRYNLNVAGRLYLLWYDTDIDLMFLTGGSRPDRYGFDFSRNLATNIEVHGEYAYLRNSRKTFLDAGGVPRTVETDAHSFLVGVRYLTSFDLTAIVEYYHNGAGFSGDEMKNFYGFIHRGYGIYQATGHAGALASGLQLAESGYVRANARQNYLYIRLSQKDPIDLLYFTPSLTWMMNIDDASCSITPELLYTGITNWEFRLRTGLIIGAGNSDFGEKQNDYRIELRVGYYF